MNYLVNKGCFLLAIAVLIGVSTVSEAFTIPKTATCTLQQRRVEYTGPVFMAESENQVLELADEEIEGVESTNDTEGDSKTVAPFLSQGEISEEALEMDWSDPKQQRVMFYIILSLLPVLFLIPLMLGSRDLIPPEALPPVEMSLLL